MPESFNWLHLTDLHYGLSGQRPLWPNVRDSFFGDLSKLHDMCGPWHAVLFTGDLVQRGAAEEFSRMQADVLDRLSEKLRELGSGNAVLLAVPGNHDLERPHPVKPEPALKWLLHPGGFAEFSEEFWADPDCAYRRVISGPFSAYQDWWRRARPRNVQDGGLPGDFSASLSVKNRKVGIIGLNTTFLQLAAGNFQGRLAWDVSQLHAACGGDAGDWIRKHDICLLLTHQGRDWLDRRSQDAYAEINPAGRFAVHLFGHMHQTVYRSISSGGGKVARCFQGNSLFSHEKTDDSGQHYERRHGYSAGRITFDKERTTLRFWPRNAHYDGNGWRFAPDHESCILSTDDGTEPEVIEHPKPLFARSDRSQKARASLREKQPSIRPAKLPDTGPLRSDAAERIQDDHAKRLLGQFIRLFSKDVEQVVRREVRQFIDLFSKDAFAAVLERIVPEPIFEEMKEVLRAEVIRRDCEYVITFAEPYDEMPPGYFVLRRELSFEVENLLNRSAIFLARSSYMGTEDEASMGWWGRHYHLELEVNKEKVPIVEGRNLSQKDGFTVLEERVPLSPRGKATIFLRGEEPCRVDSGWNSYIQRTPAAGIQVDIRNEYSDVIETLGVQMYHPAANAVTQSLTRRYELARAFLPGQGFLVIWRKKEPSS